MITIDSSAYHLAALAALEEADALLGEMAQPTTDEPHTSDAITREWVEEVLGQGVDGVRLVELVAGDGHAGMTERSKWRLKWCERGQAAGLPGTVFVKATPSDAYHRKYLSIVHMGYTEVNFYKLVQPSIPDITPKSYFGRAYPGGRYILLLEDLEERQIRPYWMNDYCSVAHAKAVGEAMAQYHAQFYESDRFGQDLDWARPCSRRFGRFWRIAGLREDRANFLDSELGADLSDELRELLAYYNDVFLDLYEYYDRLPATLVHGDSHLGNSFATPDGKAGLLDWQLIFRCSPFRDLAYFTYSALTNEDRQANERSLFENYLDAMADRGVKLDRAQSWDRYCTFILERWDAAIKAPLRGYFGHDPKCYRRQADSIHAGLAEHDVLGRLKCAMKSG